MSWGGQHEPRYPHGPAPERQSSASGGVVPGRTPLACSTMKTTATMVALGAIVGQGLLDRLLLFGTVLRNSPSSKPATSANTTAPVRPARDHPEDCPPAEAELRLHPRADRGGGLSFAAPAQVEAPPADGPVFLATSCAHRQFGVKSRRPICKSKFHHAAKWRIEVTPRQRRAPGPPPPR